MIGLEGWKITNRIRFLVAIGLIAAIVCGGATWRSNERRAKAERLVAKFDTLTSKQRKELSALGEDAFDALLPVVRQRLSVYNKEGAKNQSKISETSWTRFAEAAGALHIVATKRQTSALIQLYRSTAVPDCQETFLEALAHKGDPSLTLPVFIDILRRGPKGEFDEDGRYDVALRAVTTSHETGATEFMMEALKDDSARPDIRNAAFITLPATAGSIGISAVVAAKDHQRTNVSLERAAGTADLGTELFRPKSDEFVWTWQRPTRLMELQTGEDGSTWGLVSCLVLGSHDDVWLARRVDGHWTNLTFTGLTSKQAPRDWTSLVSRIDSFRKDSDGDGWADLVERRLGTDSQKADTDGDGLKDSEDRNPLATPRKLSETEQVLAAAFEARFRFVGGRQVPAVVEFPRGIKPFELMGLDRVVIPQVRKNVPPIAALFWQGAAFISFSGPGADLTGKPIGEGTRSDNILWSKDRRQARLQLTTSYGGLDATGYDIQLKKFGATWVVVGMRMAWIS